MREQLQGILAEQHQQHSGGKERSFRRVALLFGGQSTEHLISCRSAHTLLKGLRELGVELLLMGISKEGEWIPFFAADEDILAEDWPGRAKAALRERARTAQPSGALQFAAGEDDRQEVSLPIWQPRQLFLQAFGCLPDVIYPGVHGNNCEDGVLQGFLQLMDLPVVGAGVLASALGMNKALSAQIWQSEGLPVLPFVVLHRATERSKWREEAAKLGYPLFVKPLNGGSSIGTYRVEREEELEAQVLKAFEFEADILLQPFRQVRELEVAVLGNEQPRAACVGEIVTEESVLYYDYETKYFDLGASQVRLPAQISEKLDQQLREMALKAYQLLGVRGYARVDFFQDRQTGEIFLNEINTLPGFTNISLFPLAWEKMGLPLPSLLETICELAIEEKERNRRRESL